jgi:hypothetical protein
VLGDIADGDHCSSSLRVSGWFLTLVTTVTQAVYVNGFIRCTFNSKGLEHNSLRFVNGLLQVSKLSV